MGREMWIGNFFDLDPTTGVLTYDCKANAYDGHDGHDSQHGRRPCERKAAGIPVYAALDGVVVTTRDGHFDDYGCSVPLGNNDTPANAVIIDHGNTQYTTYLHLRSGSVMVAPGQSVRAGQQIALVGSSGKSTAPHLHLETKFNGVKYETFPGNCNNVASGWEDLEMPAGLHLTEAYIASNGAPKGQWTTGTRLVGSAFTIVNRPPNSSIEFRFIRPNGSASVHPVVNWNNPAFSNVTLWNYAWNVNLNMLGTWTLHLVVNGEDLVALPFEVVASDAEVANRPPLPIQAAFDPVRPQPERALFCRLQSSHLLVDPDYQLVRYRYEWSVNGAEVRELVSGGQADALPAGSFAYGDVVECRLTPIDEMGVEGPPHTLSRRVGGTISGKVTSYGQPLEGVTIRAGASEAVTGPDGTYAIEGVAPASYQLTAVKPGFDLAPNPLNVTAAPDAVNANFTATWAAPKNLTATVTAALQVRLNWQDPLSNETGYRIDRRIDAGAWAELASVGANTVTYLDVSASPGVQNSYRVSGRVGNVYTNFSNVVSVVIGAPNPPAGLKAAPVSQTRIDLTWLDQSDDEDGFKLERRQGSGAFQQIAQLSMNVTAYADSAGLVANTSYGYRIRSFSSQGDSDFTAEATATTLPKPPDPPDNLTAVAKSQTKIDLTWADKSSSEDGFTVERKKGTEAFAQIASLGMNVVSFSDSGGLTANTAYTYRVRAFNSGGVSAYSNAASATTLPFAPADPSSLTATAISTSAVDLTWRDNSDDEGGFKIERRKGTGAYSQIAAVLVDSTSYRDAAGLLPGTEYSYRVRAYNTQGNSGYSNEATAVTNLAAPAAPTTLTATALGQSKVQLKWRDNAANEEGFKIERRTGAGSYAQIATAAANVLTVDDANGLTAFTAYSYRVRAYNSGATPPIPTRRMSPRCRMPPQRRAS